MPLLQKRPGGRLDARRRKFRLWKVITTCGCRFKGGRYQSDYREIGGSPFFRMAANNGLWIIVAPALVEKYRSGDQIEIDVEDERIFLNREEFKLPLSMPLLPK